MCPEFKPKHAGRKLTRLTDSHLEPVLFHKIAEGVSSQFNGQWRQWGEKKTI